MYYGHQYQPVIERDPTINKMRLDAFNAMEDIIKQTFPVEPPHAIDEIKFVSFEDALKELAMDKQNKFV